MLPVNYDEITTGTDMSTNYQIVPNDRIVVPVEPAPPSQGKSSGKAPVERKELPDALQAIPQYAGPSSTQPDGIHRGISDPRALRRKLNEMEKKLDSILKKLEEPKPAPQPATAGEKRVRREEPKTTGSPQGRAPSRTLTGLILERP